MGRRHRTRRESAKQRSRCLRYWQRIPILFGRTGGGMSPTTEAPTPARASVAGGGGRDGSGRHGAAGWAGLLLLTAVAAGLLGQGAFYARVRWYLGVLVAAAAVLALVAWPPTRDDT